MVEKTPDTARVTSTH